jgi:hypothetical protein
MSSIVTYLIFIEIWAVGENRYFLNEITYGKASRHVQHRGRDFAYFSLTMAIYKNTENYKILEVINNAESRVFHAIRQSDLFCIHKHI